MKVSATKPFQIIYSLFEHEFLGYLFQPFIVQTKVNGDLTYQHQIITEKTASDFSSGLDDNDFQLITLIDQIQQDFVVNKFHKEKIRPSDFFAKYFVKRSKQFNSHLIEYIRIFIEKKMSEILKLLLNYKRVFIMGEDGEPTWKEIIMPTENTKVYFHLDRGEQSTHYYALFKYMDQKVEYQFKDTRLICNQPLWILIKNSFFVFDHFIDGKKITPFFTKWHIDIPRTLEQEYFEKIIIPLMENNAVYLKGMNFYKQQFEPKPILKFKTLQSANLIQNNLFSTTEHSKNSVVAQRVVSLHINLEFNYGEYSATPSNTRKFGVILKFNNNSWDFTKFARDHEYEKRIYNVLKNLGLNLKNGKIFLQSSEFFSWVNQNFLGLKEAGIEIIQKKHLENDNEYFIGTNTLEFTIQEEADWFDLKGKVKIGNHEMKFLDLRHYILSDIHEILLPDGKIAIIPDEWFARLSGIFKSSGGKESVNLQKYHLGLIENLCSTPSTSFHFDEKFQNLDKLKIVEDLPLHPSFSGELREYQKAGYNWLHHLKKYSFSGFLADDMGLGKTVQTLAYLNTIYHSSPRAPNPSLIIMPTSLIFNWLDETKKFTPDLKVFVHTGQNRLKTTKHFLEYDLIFTTYGIIRIDNEMLKEFPFYYIILDESQAIKNPSSQTSQCVKSLNSKYKILLSGTPVENTTLDLWSQMQFANPGLLGTHKFFINNYLSPIDKQKNTVVLKELHELVKPFILRRTKEEVAKELPPKIEQIIYSQMTSEQSRYYEETKSKFRNYILSTIANQGIKKSQFVILKGLTQLRQIAIHPRMIDTSYLDDSGKFLDLVYMIENALHHNHKILIFSQFVKFLSILQSHLQNNKINYTYLDGSTRDRKSVIDKFQNSKEVNLFLISLKAGGLGLNLTAADYVFVIDPWWNPAVEEQAVNRAHRIGQDKNVFIYKFITKASIEEKILNLQNAKKWLARELISTESSIKKGLTEEDVKNLFA